MESLAPLEPSSESRFDTVETAVEPPLPQMSALQLAVDSESNDVFGVAVAGVECGPGARGFELLPRPGGPSGPRKLLPAIAPGLDVAAQQASVRHLLTPLLDYLLTEHDVSSLSPIAFSDLLWNLFAAAGSRMQGSDNLQLVTGSPEVWYEATVTWIGDKLATNQGHPAPKVYPAWSFIAIAIGCVGLLLESWVASGRGRFYVVMCGTLLIAVGIGRLIWPTEAPRVTSMLPSTATPRPNMQGTSRDDFLPPLEPIPVETTTPPPSAPPFPVSQVVETSTMPRTIEVGAVVDLTGAGSLAALAGQRGVVSAVDGMVFEVTLHNGIKLGNLKSGDLVLAPNGGVGLKPSNPGVTSAPAVAPMTSAEFYAPLSSSTMNAARAQQQAGRLKDALNKSYGMQAMVSSWASLFWQAVKNEADIYGLDGAIMKSLQAHGYIGPGTLGPPRYEELKNQLQEIETLGSGLHGAGGTLLRPGAEEPVRDPEQLAWHLKLPPDLQRAAPELYRNIRAEGVSSVRQWVNEQHPTLEMKATTQYQDLFMAATIIDFELADCKSEQSLMHKLATSDSLEIHLRKLGAFIYYRRTKDKTGAQRMLGVRAPGTGADIAPKWMIDDANVHSKTEYQRMERGSKMSKLESGGGHQESGGKQGGKHRKGGGRGGKAGRKGGQQPTQG
eukprot:s2492_g12.t1